MILLYISKIYWLDIETGEAIVRVTDGNYELECYMSNCNYKVGDCVKTDIEVLGVEKVELTSEKNQVKYSSMENGSLIVGNLQEIGRLKIGGLFINIGVENIPKDLHKGEDVIVKISRLDIW